MTAKSNDGKEARPRASQALRASMVAPARPSTPAAADASAATPAGAADKVKMTKYSIQLVDADALRFDELALAARRKLGRRVDKSELLRALLLLAADDASLRGQLIDQLRG
jgi:hypothetical protein